MPALIYTVTVTTSDGVTTFDATSPPVTLTIPGEFLVHTVHTYAHCARKSVVLRKTEGNMCILY